MTVVVHVCKAPKEMRVRRIAEAADSLILVWVFVLSLSIMVCCVDVFDAQGLLMRKGAESQIHRVRQDFKTGRWFVAGAVPGIFSVVMLIATTVFKWKIPESKETPVAKALQTRREATAQKEPRNHAFDHMKYLATNAVVLAHFVKPEGYSSEASQSIIFHLCVSFAMGTFTFCSGYNAPVEAKETNPRRRARILQIGACLFISTTLYILYDEYFLKPQTRAHFSKEEAQNWDAGTKTMDLDSFWIRLTGPMLWHLWYLFSLIMWLLLAPVWMTLRLPFLCSLIVAVGTIYTTEAVYLSPFPVGKSLEYLPLFIAGCSTRLYGYSRPLMEYARQPYSKAAAGACLLYFIGFVSSNPFSFWSDWAIFMIPGLSVDIKMYDRQRWYPIGKLAFIIFTLSILASLVTVLPNRKTYFSKAAGGSLVPYVYHYAFYRAAIAFGFYGNKEYILFNRGHPEWWRQVLCVVFALAVTNILFIPQVAGILKHIIMPPMGFLFKKDLKKEITESNKEYSSKKTEGGQHQSSTAKLLKSDINSMAGIMLKSS